MALKEKKYKYIEDVLEEYILLQEEKSQLSLSVEKAKKKQEALLSDIEETVIKTDDAEDLFKAYTQVKKIEEKLAETEEELKEVEDVIRNFLRTIPEHQLAYDRKDDQEKTKITHMFWLEEDVVQTSKG